MQSVNHDLQYASGHTLLIAAFVTPSLCHKSYCIDLHWHLNVRSYKPPFKNTSTHIECTTCTSYDLSLWSSQMKEKSFIIKIPKTNIWTHLGLLILIHYTLWFLVVRDPHILAYNFYDVLCQCAFYLYYKIHLNLGISNILTDLPEDGHVGRTMLEDNKTQMQ